jgi:hypothetical protein
LHNLLRRFTWPPNHFGKVGAELAVVVDFSEITDGLEMEMLEVVKGLGNGSLALGHGFEQGLKGNGSHRK